MLGSAVKKPLGHTQSGNKKRGNFSAFQNLASSWPLCRAAQQYELSLRARSTPRRCALYSHASLLNEELCKLCNDLTSGTVPFELIERAFLFGLNPTRVTGFSQHEAWTWILPDTFFSHICSLSFQGTWHKPGTSPKKRASSCYCFCHTCPRESRFWTRWVIFHSHTTISHGGYTASDTLAQYSWELSIRTANSNL